MEIENTSPATVPESNNALQADEVSGRPSETENVSASDRLSETKQTSENTASYVGLEMPREMKGCEENFASFKRLAAELKLPAQTAQKLVEWELNCWRGGRQAQEEARTQILERWTAQTRQEFGPSYHQHIEQALSAAERFGGRELRSLLEETGLNAHPTVVKTFYEIYRQTGEDVSASGSVRAAGDKTFAEALYGKAA